MPFAMHVIAGAPSPFLTQLEALLAGAPALGLPTLINADAEPDAEAVIHRCRQFAADAGASGALVLTILHAAPPGLDQFARHATGAVLWSFTRHAALAWAPQRIRVNAVALGAAPAPSAAIDDVVRTVHAVARFSSMTGQMVRLGTSGPQPFAYP